MNELNNNSINEKILNNNPLIKSVQETPKENHILHYPNANPTTLSKLPPIKSNFIIRKTSTSDNSLRDNKFFYNCLSIKPPINNSNQININNNNNYIQTFPAKGDINQNNTINHNDHYKNYNSNLNTIKDENEKVGFNIHNRNLELIKKLVEKRKKEKEEKNELLNKLEKTPMERLNLFKQSLLHKGIALVQHKKLEPINLNDPKNIDDNITYYYQIIHEGNSSEVIEECLKRRGHWKKFNSDEMHSINNKNNSLNGSSFDNNINISNIDSFPNLLWSHCSKRIDFSDFYRSKPGCIKRMTNHFEFHNEITNKLNLFINMMIFCEKNKYDLFSFLPMTFPIKYESKCYLLKMNSFLNIFNNIDKFISDKSLDYKYRNLFVLETKERIGYRTSFHIPKNHYYGRNLWLVKAIDLNRGRCIKISDNYKGIENIIKNFYIGIKKDFYKNGKYEEIRKEDKNLELPKLNNNRSKEIKTIPNILKVNSSNDLYSNVNFGEKKLINVKKKLNIKIKINNSNNKNYSQSPKNLLREKILNTYKQYKLFSHDPQTYQNSSVIIQKYIEKPLCYKGRKCDMRLWVLLTWDFNVYLFKEGHFKASSIPYDVNSLDSYVHLTNYSVQKYNQNFAKFETGNEISFKDFEISVDNRINVIKDLMPKLKEIIIYTMKCSKNKINKCDRRLCFEIFGYDFMFDIDYNPYLLEINTNPGLEISSPLIEMLIPRLIDDAFKLTIDKVFLLSQKNIEKMMKNPLKVGGYDDDENMWEFLCNVN